MHDTKYEKEKKKTRTKETLQLALCSFGDGIAGIPGIPPCPATPTDGDISASLMPYATSSRAAPFKFPKFRAVCLAAGGRKFGSSYSSVGSAKYLAMLDADLAVYRTKAIFIRFFDWIHSQSILVAISRRCKGCCNIRRAVS